MKTNSEENDKNVEQCKCETVYVLKKKKMYTIEKTICIMSSPLKLAIEVLIGCPIVLGGVRNCAICVIGWLESVLVVGGASLELLFWLSDAEHLTV